MNRFWIAIYLIFALALSVLIKKIWNNQGRRPASCLRLLSVLFFLVIIISVFFDPYISSDAAEHYLPMAREFSIRNYERAFFPSIPPLVPLLTGIISMAGLCPHTAIKLLNGLALGGSMFFCYRIFLRFFEKEKALYSLIIFFCIGSLLHFALWTGLDGVKMFLLLFTFDRLFCYLEQSTWRLIFQISFGLALLSLCWAGGVIFFPLIALILFFAPFFTGQSFMRKLSLRLVHLALLGCFCFLMVSPWLAYIHQKTGIVALSGRHVSIMKKVIGDAEDTDDAQLFRGEKNAYRQNSIPIKLKNTIQGSALFLMPFYAVGVFIRIRTGRFRIYPDGICFAVFVWNLVFVWLMTPNILSRYFIVVVPFLFPFAIEGGEFFYRRISHKWPKSKRALLSVLGLTIVFAVGDSSYIPRRAWRDYFAMHVSDSRFQKCIVDRSLETPGFLAAQVEIGDWIHGHAEELDRNRVMGDSDKRYRNDRSLVLTSSQPHYAYYAEADAILTKRFIRECSTADEMLSLAKDLGGDVFILDRKLSVMYPGIELSSRLLKVREWEQYEVTVYKIL